VDTLNMDKVECKMTVLNDIRMNVETEFKRLFGDINNTSDEL